MEEKIKGKISINRIMARPATGIYKDQDIEVEFGNNSEDTIVRADGKMIDGVQFVGVKCRVGQKTVLTIEKVNLERLKNG